jgi:putative ABC transport system permease protein
MILTLVTLAVGGAVYLGAINLRQSVIDSVDTLFGSQRFDMVLRFAEPHAVDSIESIVSPVTGVARAEAWSGARAAVKRRDGTVGNAFPVTAMPAASVMMLPSIRTGRWLKSGDGNDIVVNQRLIDEEPALSVGSTVTLVIKGGETSWRIVGVSDSNPSPIAYAPRELIAPLVAGGRASAVVVASSLKSPASEFDVMQRLRTTLEDNGFAIQSGQLMREQRTVVEDHLLMVAGFLGIMAKLIIIVGGLGLASTLSMGVLERTREIGVMRAVGARNLWIAGIILIEGLVISTASWLAAIPLSIPMSAILARAFGRIMFSVPVTFLSPADGLLRWLAVVTLVAIAACAWPALRAMRIPTARALAYE